MNGRFKSLTIVAMCGAVVLACAPRANATVQITLTDGTSSVTLADGASGDLCAAANCISFNGAFGNYLINVSTGFSSGGAFNPFLDVHSLHIATAGNAGPLTISTSANGYTTAVPQFSFQVGGTNSLNGPFSFAGYGGNSNTLFDTSQQLGSTLAFAAGTSPFAASTTAAFGSSANPYSLTIVANVTGVTAGAISFDAAIDAVPEPATMALLGAVLLITASGLRRKFHRA
jgi:hypothetical protein